MVKASIIGISGYTGEELLKILSNHPSVKIISAGARGDTVGKRIGDIYPGIDGYAADVKCIPAGEVYSPSSIGENPDVVFLALPHGEAAEFVWSFTRRNGGVGNVKVIDLSADFRLKNPDDYLYWYKLPHPHPEMLEESVYGLPELYREKIKTARIVANPGCYPTTAILGLAPLIVASQKGEISIDTSSIIIDSKSGVSGGGRKFARNYFETEHPNHKPYNIAGVHRHTPEIEQELGKLASKEIKITFTPSIIPVERGMLSVIYVNLAGNSSSKVSSPETTENLLHDIYTRFYDGEPFVQVIPFENKSLPSIKNVVGTNLCQIGVAFDARTSRVIIVSAIDNLVKGASGQAVQNMNIMFGLNETEGLASL